jgi:hypothetical protein
VQAGSHAWEVLCTKECWNKLSSHPESEKFSATWPEDREMWQMKGYENDCLVALSRK